MERTKGFTLIELLVTISIVAIIAMFAAPTFSDMIAKQNLNKSTQELRALLIEARGKAVIERRNVTVQFNSSATNTDSQLNWMPSGKSVLKSGPASVIFQMNGAINSNVDLDFQLCDSLTSPKNSKSFSLSKMGVLQIITDGTCS